ncbi:MAG TPA: nucleotidyltransferase family protein [Solirubrobacteraceae bacterium]|nr:nucleotidyltransferase family protein [Solirubrobacteraceae bacterium]
MSEQPASSPATPPLAAGPVVVGLVLAAGAGRRFGWPKQLALFDGRPLLEHALLAMASARRLDSVVVVLGAHADAVLAGVERHGASAVICQDWEEGQAASLRTGVAAVASRADAVVVTLGDQPSLDARAIDRVVEGRDGVSLAIRASYGRRPGHPVLLERGLFDRVTSLRGDEGARGLLAGAAVKLVACDGLGSDLDIDTVEELRLSGGGSTPAS